jgi:phosphomannomutase
VVADTLGDRHRVLGDGPTLMTPVGYGKIKVIMHDHPEIAFGAEHSGHYMFRDFYRADSGMLAGLIMLELAAELHAEGKTLSAELEEMRSRYFPSGEINFEMPAADPATDAIARAVDEFSSDAERMYAVAPEGIKQIDSYPPEFDQTVEDVRVEAEDWWFCMRKSGTEGSGGGICRLYVEAVGEEALMREKCDALAQLVGQEHRM